MYIFPRQINCNWSLHLPNLGNTCNHTLISWLKDPPRGRQNSITTAQYRSYDGEDGEVYEPST